MAEKVAVDPQAFKKAVDEMKRPMPASRCG
jgi:hypothetical protein